jgi:hypothetical protein
MSQSPQRLDSNYYSDNREEELSDEEREEEEHIFELFDSEQRLEEDEEKNDLYCP